MGTILAATCRCGYTVPSLKFGAGMADISTSCSIPAIDPQSMNIISHDIISEAVKVLRLLFYTPILLCMT